MGRLASRRRSGSSRCFLPVVTTPRAVALQTPSSRLAMGRVLLGSRVPVDEIRQAFDLGEVKPPVVQTCGLASPVGQNEAIRSIQGRKRRGDYRPAAIARETRRSPSSPPSSPCGRRRNLRRRVVYAPLGRKKRLILIAAQRAAASMTEFSNGASPPPLERADIGWRLPSSRRWFRPPHARGRASDAIEPLGHGESAARLACPG
jgi:hypothetical protein